MATSMHRLVESLQESFCIALESEDSSQFKEDIWHRKEGGGGKTRIIENGSIIEKGGVNTSAVYGHLSGLSLDMFKTMLSKQNIPFQHMNKAQFFATGISVVIHPFNPFIPTVHANYRYFELISENHHHWWFGGGADMTPFYLFEEDASHFHAIHKEACDALNPSYYPLFKSHCDDYFYLPHRNETRGIGGIFYDYQRSESQDHYFDLASSCGNAFINAYLPIIQRRKTHTFTPSQKQWQSIRRGRYAEFNLSLDRGTLFGLKTGGRTESILMSLPPKVEWRYDYSPRPKTPESKLIEILKSPRSWV